MCVHTGRQADRQLSSTHSTGSNTSAFDCLLQTPVRCKSSKDTVLLRLNKAFEK